MPVVVCLCGSTRFRKEETLKGKIVLTVHPFEHTGARAAEIPEAPYITNTRY